MEDTYKKILVPVDGSEQSIKALKVANAIAKRNDGELVVMTAQDYAPESMAAPVDAQAYQHLKDYAEKFVNETLEAATKELSDDVDYVTVAENGNPKAEIVRYAENNDIDLIVMGATGKGAISRLLVGSTTSYVVNHAPCTVTVVK